MADLTDYFIDPTVASDGGAGTLASPWTRADGDCYQYALNNITILPNGIRINIKAGTPHTDKPTATCDYTTYTAPSAQSPVFWQGYTSAVGDGGLGVWQGGGHNTAQHYVYFCDCKFTGGATANAGIAGGYIGCVFDGSDLSATGYMTNFTSNSASICGCYYFCDTNNTVLRKFHQFGSGDRIVQNVFDMGLMNHSTDCFAVYDNTSADGKYAYNLFRAPSTAPSTARPILTNSDSPGGSFYKNTYDGNGRNCNLHYHPTTATPPSWHFLNTMFGASATGGIAIETGGAASNLRALFNTFYDNDTDLDGTTGDLLVPLANSTATGALAADASTDDYELQTDQGGDVESTLGHSDQPTNPDKWRGAFAPAAATAGGSSTITSSLGNI